MNLAYEQGAQSFHVFVGHTESAKIGQNYGYFDNFSTTTLSLLSKIFVGDYKHVKWWLKWTIIKLFRLPASSIRGVQVCCSDFAHSKIVKNG